MCSLFTSAQKLTGRVQSPAYDIQGRAIAWSVYRQTARAGSRLGSEYLVQPGRVTKAGRQRIKQGSTVQGHTQEINAQ